MGPESHLIVAATDMVAAILLAGIGYLMGRRSYSDETKQIGFTFQIWWYVFALVAVLNGAFELLSASDAAPAVLLLALTRLKVIAVATGIWCLGSYIVFLWAGEDRWQTPLAVFSALHALVFLGLVETGGFGLGLGVAEASVASGLGMHPLTEAAVFVLFFAPLIVLAIGLLALLPRLQEAEHRFRVSAVASALLLWQVASIVRFNPNTTSQPQLLVAIAILFLGASLITYLAYRPPMWLASVLGVETRSERGDQTRATS